MKPWPLVLIALGFSACSPSTAEILPDTPTPTVPPTYTVTCTATSTVSPTLVPTSTVTPTSVPEIPTPVPQVIYPDVPVLDSCQSMTPYKLVAIRPGHDREMQIMWNAAQQWNGLTGLDLFNSNSSSLIGVAFEGDPECNSALYPVAAVPPGAVGEPYTGLVWMCIREFLDNGCVSPQHELGHILCLADNHQPGSDGVMSSWMGHYPGDGGISYEEWCHNPILPQEIAAVKALP